MKTEEYVTKTGEVGYTYVPQVGDEVIAVFGRVGSSKKGEYENHFLKVKLKDNKEVTIKITAGQKKVLDKTEDLTGKTIVFEKYVKYGKDQIGARVLK